MEKLAPAARRDKQLTASDEAVAVDTVKNTVNHMSFGDTP